MKAKLFLITGILLILGSCEKSTIAPGPPPPVKYCAVCKETTTNTQAPDFCADLSSVNLYISALVSNGQKYGQVWKCTKHLQ